VEISFFSFWIKEFIEAEGLGNVSSGLYLASNLALKSQGNTPLFVGSNFYFTGPELLIRKGKSSRVVTLKLLK
jgi:hypothetical protein